MNRLAARAFVITALATSVQCFSGPAFAQGSNGTPTFGSRTENEDGSVALSVGRNLQSQWDARIGVDARIAPDRGPSGVADIIQHGQHDPSSGSVWGRVEAPAPLFWDKAAVDARLDPLQEQSRISATMSRTVPLGHDVSVTLEDRYSATQSLQGEPSALAAVPPGASVWETERSVRFNLKRTGTTLSAGVSTLSGDAQWHNRISAEQQIGGPLSVTTTVTDPAGGASSKSISARFRHTW